MNNIVKAVYPGDKIIINIWPHASNDAKQKTIKISKNTLFDIIWPGEISNGSKYSDLNYNYQFYHPQVLIWLKDIIENNTDKKIFVFSHHFLPHKCGNSPGIPKNASNYVYGYVYPNDDLVNVAAAGNSTYCNGANALTGMEFYFINKLNNEHKNVVFFSGHSHLTWSNMNDKDVAGTTNITSNKFRNCHIDNHDYNIVKPSDYESLIDDCKPFVYTRSSDTPKCESGYWVALPSLSKPTNSNYANSKLGDKNTLRANADITIMDVHQNGVKIKGYSLLRNNTNENTGKDNKYNVTYSNYDLNNPLIEKDLLLFGNDLGSYKYSVGLLSDLHLHEENNYHNSEGDENEWWYDADDLKKALEIFNSEYKNSTGHDISFICSCGDVTESYCTNDDPNDSTRVIKDPWPEHDAQEFYDVYRKSNHNNLKFYTALGNHDHMGIFNRRTGETTDSAYYSAVNDRINNIWLNKIQCFINSSSNLNYCNYSDTVSNRNKLNYWFEHNGDIYVIMSVDYGDDIWDAPGARQWSNRMIKSRTIIDANSSDQYIQAIKSYISNTDYTEESTYDPGKYNPSNVTWNSDISYIFNEAYNWTFYDNNWKAVSDNANSNEYIYFRIKNLTNRHILYNGKFSFIFKDNETSKKGYSSYRVATDYTLIKNDGRWPEGPAGNPNLYYTGHYYHGKTEDQPTNWIIKKGECSQIMKIPKFTDEGQDITTSIFAEDNNKFSFYMYASQLQSSSGDFKLHNVTLYVAKKDEQNHLLGKTLNDFKSNIDGKTVYTIEVGRVVNYIMTEEETLKEVNNKSYHEYLKSPTEKYLMPLNLYFWKFTSTTKTTKSSHNLGSVYFDIQLRNTTNTTIYIAGRVKFLPMKVIDSRVIYGMLYAQLKDWKSYASIAIAPGETITLNHNDLEFDPEDGGMKNTSVPKGTSWLELGVPASYINGGKLEPNELNIYTYVNDNGNKKWTNGAIKGTLTNHTDLIFNAGTSTNIELYTIDLTAPSNIVYWITP